MKLFRVLLIICSIILTSIIIHASSTESVCFNYPIAPEVQSKRMIMPGVISRLSAAGGYSLPMDQKTIRFPVGTIIESYKVTGMTTGTMNLTRPLSIIDKKRVSNQIVSAPSQTKKRLGSEYYPDRWFDLEYRQGLDVDTLQPTLFVTCRVFPVRANSTSANYLSSLNIEITTSTPTQTSQRDAAALLIIAPEAYTSDLQSFATHKQSIGVSTVIRTIENINTNETGRDLQEKIKYAIERAYRESSVRYVILAGDVSQIPVRYGCHVDWGEMGMFEHVPADIYYADLYNYFGEFCDWDYNENNLFGEFEYGLGNPDRCDFAPDVMLGRIPANDTTELTTVLNKIIQYETTVTGAESWTNRVILAAADTFGPNNGENTGIPEGEYLKEQIAEDCLQTFNITKLYETEIYDRTDELTEDTLVSAINAGAGYVNFAYHGFGDGWQLPNGFFENDSVSRLTNTTKLPVVFAHACLTAQYDFENPQCPDHGYAEKCFGETMLLHSTGGCIAYFGASRGAMAGGWGIGDNTGNLGMVDYAFFEGVHAGHRTLGRLHVNAVNTLLFQRGIGIFEEFLTLLEFVYLGDPSLSACGLPVAPDFDLAFKGYDDTIVGDGDGCFEPGETVELILKIANDGADETNLTAEIHVDDPEINIITGSIGMPDFPRGFNFVLTPGFELSLSAAANTNRMIPVQISITGDSGVRVFDREIYIGAKSNLEANQILITTDDNSDRHAGQGETVRFAPALHNTGCSTAIDVIGEIVINDSYVTDYGVRGTGVLPPIEPGETRTPLKLFYASIDPMTPHGHIINCHITLNCTATNQVWVYDLPIQVYDFSAPTVEAISIQPKVPQPGQLVTVTAQLVDGEGIDSAELSLDSIKFESPLSYTMYDDGNHGDGLENDGLFGVQFEIVDYDAFFSCDILCRDGLGNSGLTEEALCFTTISFEKNDSVLIVSRAENDHYLGLYCQALADAGYGYDIWSWWRGVPPMDVLSQYQDGAVVWFYSLTYPIMDSAARDAVSRYLALGGNLLLTEQDVGYALFDAGTSDTAQWCRDTLCFEFRVDNSMLKTINGITGDPVSDSLVFTIDGGSGAQNQSYPSLIDALDPGQGCFFYSDYEGPYTGCAGLRSERDGSRLIFLAFGFEGISSQSHRCDVMRSSMEWFGVSESQSSVYPWDQSQGWWMGPELLPLQGRLSTSVYFDPSHRIYHTGGLIKIDDSSGSLREIDRSVYFIDTETGQNGDTGFDVEIDRFYHMSAVLDSDDGPWIYFLGGWDLDLNLIRETERFNPLTGQCEILALDPMPLSISGRPAAWINAENKVYLTGIRLPIEPYVENETWVFDPLAAPGSRWKDLNAPLIEPRQITTLAELNHCLYAIGGTNWDGTAQTRSRSIEMLDLTQATPQWISIDGEAPSDFLDAEAIGIQGGSNVELDNTILVTGSTSSDLRQSWFFDPGSGTWKEHFAPNCSRRLSGPLLHVPSPRGGEIWSTHSFNIDDWTQELRIHCSTEILRLGQSHRQDWIGIRSNKDTLQGGCTLTVSLDIAGDDAATPVDCYVVLEVEGIFLFLTADPVFPSFSSDPVPFFLNAPLPVTTTYCGPLFELQLPVDVTPFECRMYAATLHSGTSELAGGVSWASVTIE